MNAPRSSALHTSLKARGARFDTLLDMPAAVQVADTDAQRAAALGIADVSCLRRIGLKGPRAGEWLSQRGVAVPADPNSWVPVEGGLVARLARTEFLVEDGPGASTVTRIAGELESGLEGVYPVWRQDCALLLAGERVMDLLRETCNVDFASSAHAGEAVTLTQMVGVSVTVLRQQVGSRACHRVWCDYSAGVYLWETLTGIAEEMGGGAVGIAAVWPALVAG